MEDIKKYWRETKFNSSEMNDNDPQRRTALQSLEERYKRFSRASLVYIVLMPAVLFNTFSRWTIASSTHLTCFIIFTITYFLTASIMDRWLARGIASIKISEMTVLEVCRRAIYYKRKHFQFMAILLPMAIIMIVWMLILLSGSEYFIYGVFSGLVIGSILGYINFKKFMNEYNEIISDL